MAKDEPLRYRVTITTTASQPLAEVTTRYQDARDDPTDPIIWSMVRMDDNGQFYFGPAGWFTLNDPPDPLSEQGVTRRSWWRWRQAHTP